MLFKMETFQLQILSENRMGNEGAKAVCDLLTENKTITYLDLKGSISVQSSFFFTSPLNPVENSSEPPAIPLTCPPRTAADPLNWEFKPQGANF